MFDICIAIIGSYVLGWIVLSFIHWLDRMDGKKYRKQNAIAAARSGTEQERLNTE
jgi:hypothetical protein